MCFLMLFSNCALAILLLTVTLITLLVSKSNKSLSVAVKNCLGSKLIRSFLLKHMSHRSEKNLARKSKVVFFLNFEKMKLTLDTFMKSRFSYVTVI